MLSALILSGERVSTRLANPGTMRRLVAVLLAVLVVGSPAAGAVSGLGSTDGVDPAVTVTVDDKPITDGERYETSTDDEIRVEAAVGDGAAAGTELVEIAVRVDGTLAKSWSVNGTSATREVRPDYDAGNNTVRVIVTDSADNVNSTTFTVYKDLEAPHVYLTSPYETDPYYNIPDGSVSGTNHTIAGRILDQSGVESITVAHTFGQSGSSTQVSDPGENFSVPIELGYSNAPDDDRENEVRIDVVDEFGNTRTYIFEINVTDGAGPSMSIEPVPTETATPRIYVAGEFSDDVWIRSANLTVEPLDDANRTRTDRLVERRAYAYDPAGRTHSFNETVTFNHPGTYRITVSVTDVTGATNERTYTVERVPYEEADLRPTIEIDRDRTVVTGNESLFLSGVSFEGLTRRLVVETRDAAGETVDYQVLHQGSNRDQVPFDTQVGIDDGRTQVIVRATDPDGNEVSTAFYVNGATQETFVGNETDADADEGDLWPQVSVTHLQDQRPGTASSSVTVRRASAGSTVALPPADGPAAVASTPNVTLDALDLSVSARTNLTGTVVVRERAAGTLRGPAGATSVATTSIQHSVPAGRVEGLGIELSVQRTYLDALGVDAGNLSVYRLADGNWTRLDTTATTDGDAVTFAAESPSLSAFALATRPASTDGTTDNGTNATAPNGTDAPENGTAPNGTAGNATGKGTANGTDTSANETTPQPDESGSQGQPQLFVSNVTVNRTQVAVNESVLVNVTVANSGNASGTYVAGLQTIQGLNRSFVDRAEVTVPPGEQRRVQFTTQFARTGNHTVSVNGTQAGPVVVSSGGGLLSILSVIPVRLIGLILGGVVGLLVVLTLVRFVLRRVGSGGDEAGG
jgi:hypothetical protein